MREFFRPSCFISSNIAAQAALIQHPRFVAGDINTAFLAEEFPHGFHPAHLAHREPILLAAVAAYARRRYIDRAMRITGQLKGHGRRVGRDWVVQMKGEKIPLGLTLVEGGCDVTHEGKTHALRTDWKLGDTPHFVGQQNRNANQPEAKPDRARPRQVLVKHHGPEQCHP